MTVSTAVRKARIRRQILKHYGPGAHPGSGTDQTVHDPSPGYDAEDEEGGGLFGEEEETQDSGDLEATPAGVGAETTDAGIETDTDSLAPAASAASSALGTPDVDPGARDIAYEDAIRPATLDEFVGQRGVVNQLKIRTEAAREQGRPLDHMLFSGPPGLGKTTLAQMMANEMGSNIKVVTAGAIKDKGDLAAMVLSLQDDDILFIDEIHALDEKTAELLYPVMEDFEVDVPLGEGGTVRMDTARFTLLGATTEAGTLPDPLRQRFGDPMKLDFYEPQDLAQIVERTSGVLGINLDASAYTALATRAQGTPRKANNLAKWMRDWAVYHDLDTVTGVDVEAALSLRGVDPGGLRREDRNYLSFLSSSEHPVGENTIASYLGEAKETIADEIEPYLLRNGYLMRTPRGRVITDRGRAHLEEYPVDWGTQDLEDAYEFYKHLPGRHDQTDHGLWARARRKISDLLDTSTTPKMLEEVADSPQESRLVRRFKLLQNLNATSPRLAEIIRDSFTPHERTHLQDLLVEARQFSTLNRYAPAFAKHYGPGPHKTGTPQSVHGGTSPHWLDDINLIRAHLRKDPSLAADIEAFALERTQQIQAEMVGKTGKEYNRLGEENHAFTSLWAEARNVDETGFHTGEMPADQVKVFEDWYTDYYAENVDHRLRAKNDYLTSGEGGLEYRPYVDRIPEDYDFLAPLVDRNYPGGPPSIGDATDIYPGAIVFGPTGPFVVEDKIGPEVGVLPNYPPGAESDRFLGPARPRPRTTAPIGRPADLPEDHIRLTGEDATGRTVSIDLPYDGIAPPMIPDHMVGRLSFEKHGSHNQKDHGNWARGTSARQLLEAVESSGEPLSGNRGHTVYVPTGSEPDSGFAVGITERGAKHPSRPSPDQIRDYMNANRDLLDQPGYHLGFWESPEGEWWIDVSQVFDSADEAFSAYPEEEAIFDFSTFESVYNPGLQSDTG